MPAGGEATTGLTTMPAFSAVGEIARLFLGRDPRELQRNWQDAHKALYLTSDGAVLAATAGIETACWDIVGNRLRAGEPGHQDQGHRDPVQGLPGSADD